MVKKLKDPLVFILILVLTGILVHQCKKGKDPVVKTKVETVIETVYDTIKEVSIVKVEKPVYVEKVKTLQGKDSIIYVDKPTKASLEANIYKTDLKSNKATAELEITALGEVLAVNGIITYPEKTTTVTNDIYHERGGLFLYVHGEVDKSPNMYGIGLDWNIKNKLVIGASVNYNNITKGTNVMGKVGIKIW